MSVCAFPGCGHPQTDHSDHFCWHEDCNDEHRYASSGPVAYPDGSRPASTGTTAAGR